MPLRAALNVLTLIINRLEKYVIIQKIKQANLFFKVTFSLKHQYRIMEYSKGTLFLSCNSVIYKKNIVPSMFKARTI